MPQLSDSPTWVWYAYFIFLSFLFIYTIYGLASDYLSLLEFADVMQVAHHYFENGIAYFTRRINRCISLSKLLLYFGLRNRGWRSIPVQLALTAKSLLSSAIMHSFAGRQSKMLRSRIPLTAKRRFGLNITSRRTLIWQCVFKCVAISFVGLHILKEASRKVSPSQWMMS